MHSLDNITVIIVTYLTQKQLLINCLKSIDNRVKIKIIENSHNFEYREEILSNFDNVEIYCTGENLGYGKGNNFGLKIAKTNYALILNPDLTCDVDFFSNITKVLDYAKDFTIIGCQYQKDKIFLPAGFFDKKKNQEFIKIFKNDKTEKLEKVDWVVGCSMLLNLKKFKNKEIFDKNNNTVSIGNIEKMSKSKKNVINPTNIINLYGADTARWFMLSDSPPERDLEWTDVGVASSHKFINKIWETCIRAKNYKAPDVLLNTNKFNSLIKSVSENIEKFHFNKSVANIYEYVNEINKCMDKKTISSDSLKSATKNLCIVIHPFTPHLSEEIWELLGYKGFCANASWPELKKNDVVNKINLPIQVNGKLKGLISSKKNDKEEIVVEKAKKLPGLNRVLKDKIIVKIIYIPGKILNIVIK